MEVKIVPPYEMTTFGECAVGELFVHDDVLWVKSLDMTALRINGSNRITGGISTWKVIRVKEVTVNL